MEDFEDLLPPPPKKQTASVDVADGLLPPPPKKKTDDTTFTDLSVGGTSGASAVQSTESEVFKPKRIGETEIEGEAVDIFQFPKTEVKESPFTDELKATLKRLPTEALVAANEIKKLKRKPTPQELQGIQDKYGITKPEEVDALTKYLEFGLKGEKTIEPSTIDYLSNAWQRGTNNARLSSYINMGRMPTEDELKTIAEINQFELPTSKITEKFNNAPDFNSAIKELAVADASDFGLWLAENVVQSFGALWKGSPKVAERALQSGAVGAGVGTAIPAIGTAAGAMTGAGYGYIVGMGEQSANLEYANTFISTLAESGVDITDEKSLKEALNNEGLIKEAKRKALLRGVPVGFFDGLSAGIGGKIVTQPGKSAFGKMAKALAEPVVQAGLGGAGAATGQLASEGKITDGKEIFTEIVAEFGTSPVEILTGSLRSNKLKSENKPYTVSKNKSELFKIFKGATKEEIDFELARQVALGKITEDQKQMMSDLIMSMNEADKVTPQGIPNRDDAVVIISEKKELEKEAENVDTAFQPIIQEKISELETEIKNLVKEEPTTEIDGVKESDTTQEVIEPIQEGEAESQVEEGVGEVAEQVEQELTPKIETKVEVSEQVENESKLKEEIISDTENQIVNEAELQDGKVVEEEAKPKKVFDYTKKKKQREQFDKNMNKYAAMEVATPYDWLVRFFATGGRIKKEDARGVTGYGYQDLFGYESKNGMSIEEMARTISDELGIEFDEIDFKAKTVKEVIDLGRAKIYSHAKKMMPDGQDKIQAEQDARVDEIPLEVINELDAEAEIQRQLNEEVKDKKVSEIFPVINEIVQMEEREINLIHSFLDKFRDSVDGDINWAQIAEGIENPNSLDGDFVYGELNKLPQDIKEIITNLINQNDVKERIEEIRGSKIADFIDPFAVEQKPIEQDRRAELENRLAEAKNEVAQAEKELAQSIKDFEEDSAYKKAKASLDKDIQERQKDLFQMGAQAPLIDDLADKQRAVDKIKAGRESIINESRKKLEAAKEKEQTVQQLLDDNIKGQKSLLDRLDDLKFDGDLTGGLMLAPKLFNGFIDVIKAGIKAGMILGDAIKKGIDYLKANGVTDVEPYLNEIELKAKEPNLKKEIQKLIKRKPTEQKRIDKAYALGVADTTAKFKEEIKKIKQDIKDGNIAISTAVKEIRKSIRDSKLNFNERQVSKLIGIVDEINTKNISDKLDEINDYLDSIEASKLEKERKDLAQDLIKAINPKSYETKGASKRSKTKISDEAKLNLISLAKSIGDQIETMTLPQLKQLKQIVDNIVEQGKIEQKAMQDLLKKIRKENTREMTQILADKAKSTAVVNTKAEAIEGLNRGDKIVIDDVIFSKSDISDLETMPDSFFNDTKVLIIPKANQFGKSKPKWNSFIYRKTDLLTQLRNALPTTKESQDWIVDNVIDRIISASNKTLSLKVGFGDKVKSLKEKVFGKGWLSKSAKYLSKETGLELKDIYGRDLVEGGMINDEAVYMYNIMKDPLMIDKALNAGFSIEQLIKIAEYVRNDDKLKQYAEEVNNLYASYLPQVNDALVNAEMTSIVPGEYGDLSKLGADKLSVLEAIYGDITLVPEQIPYSPAQVKGVGDSDFNVDDLFTSGKNAASVIAGNVIERKAQGQLLIVPNETAMENYRGNMLNMISKLPLYKDMFSMFRDGGENMDLIKSIYGDKFAQTFKANLQDVMLEKNNTTKNQNNFLFNYIDRQAALIMMLNLRSAAFQALSAPNFYIDAAKDGVLFETVKNTFIRNQKVKDASFETKESGWFRDRIDKTFSPEIQDLRNAKDKSKFGKVLDDVLSKGYILTKVMDSYVGISFVGSPYYAALKDKYYNDFKAEGLSDIEAAEKAQEKAMTKFSLAANKTQQSSNPSFMSEDQKDRFSRMFLTFGSVNLLYTREIIRAASDYKNGRESAKSAVATIAYYTLLQQGIFLALQTGLAAIATGIAGIEDDEEKEKLIKQKSLTITNQTFNAILRGFGVYGAIIAATKDTLFDIGVFTGRKDESILNELYEENKDLISDSGKAKNDSQLLLNALGNAIPNLSIKIKKIQRAIREDDKLKAAMAGTEAATNIPATQVNRIMDMVSDLQNEYFSMTEKMLRLIDQLPYERLKELRDKAEKESKQSLDSKSVKTRDVKTKEVKNREVKTREIK
jgi:hypothetical protein